MNKSEIIDNFLSMLNSQNCNKVDANNGMDELFGKGNNFSVVCNKCGSLDVQIIGERGIDYGGYTGWQDGTTVIKCISCGAATSVYSS